METMVEVKCSSYFVLASLCLSQRQTIHGTAIIVKSPHMASACCPRRGLVGFRSGSRRGAGKGRGGTGMIFACAGSDGKRAVYSSTLTMGESPQARLEGR